MDKLESSLEGLEVSKIKCLRILTILRDQGKIEYIFLFRKSDRRYTEEVEDALETLKRSEYNFQKQDAFTSAKIKSPKQKVSVRISFLS